MADAWDRCLTIVIRADIEDERALTLARRLLHEARVDLWEARAEIQHLRNEINRSKGDPG